MVEVFKSNGPLAESKVKAYEEQYGIVFPEPYRDYLLKYNSWIPLPADFQFAEPEPYKIKHDENIIYFVGFDANVTGSNLDTFGKFVDHIPNQVLLSRWS